MRYICFVFSVFLLFLFPSASYSQESSSGLEARKKLASDYHQIRPVNIQVEMAVDAGLQRLNFDELRKKELKRVLLKNVDYEELKSHSINSMAEIFTEHELQWMVDYYSQPEALAIEKKLTIYNDLVMPVVTRMLDKAFMELRTGAPAEQ